MAETASSPFHMYQLSNGLQIVGHSMPEVEPLLWGP